MQFERYSVLPRYAQNTLRSLINRHISENAGLDAGPRAYVAAVPPTLRTIWDARRDILKFLRTGDDQVGYHLRRQFGLASNLAQTHTVPSDMFSASKHQVPAPGATIIVPVFNAFDHVARLLGNLTVSTERDQAILLVNDGSDDPRISHLLSQFSSATSNASVITLPKNLGFVAAANTGLELIDPNHHAILLNSDTLPPKDWVPRLLAPLAEDSGIASVSPLSNAAEILSIPRPGIETTIDLGFVETLDQIAVHLRSRNVELPTGIGFCIAMNRRYLDDIGGFDPRFGRGYGEEVDWCLRAKAIGGRNVVSTNLFVGHEGSGSFGKAARVARIAQASRKIAQNHPSFGSDALDWEHRDPIGPERLALSLGWAAITAIAPVNMFIAHTLGGGAETALQNEIAAHFAKSGDPIVILRAGGPHLWRIELLGPRFTVTGDVTKTSTLFRLLRPLERRRVIYSCAVGSEDPGALPATILELAQGQSLEVRLHDYFLISPSWNLMGSDGCFVGVPDLDCPDPVHGLAPHQNRLGVSHRHWRKNWSEVIAAADEVTVFSTSSAEIIENAYMPARGKVVVRPHSVATLPKTLHAGGQSIGVLGGINLPKGGNVLASLAQVTTRRIVLIGELDGRFRLSSPHLVHGRYDPEEIATLAERYGVGIWLIPSVCPETFSFATHEALATGLPVVAFDIGAQGEAVRNAPNGHPLTMPPDSVLAMNAFIESLFQK